jgi:hypothetical protein
LGDKSLLLLGTARLSSSRLRGKMLCPFAGTTLLDIHLSTLREAWATGAFSSWGIALCRGEDGADEMVRAAEEWGVPVIDRSLDSVSGLRLRSEELHFLARFGESHVIWVNGCLPMLKARTLYEAAMLFKALPDVQSMTTVSVAHNWFWRLDGMAVNNLDPMCVSTQGCDPLAETGHGFHIFGREWMLRWNSYWGFRGGDGVRHHDDPMLFRVGDPRELVDVDDEWGFRKAEVLWRELRDEAVPFLNPSADW